MNIRPLADRVMIKMIEAEETTKSGIILYNTPVRNLNWFIDSGWGIRFERLMAEFDRIEKYSAMGHLATAQEVVEYQKWKESLLHA